MVGVGSLGVDTYRRQLTAIGTGMVKMAFRPSPLHDHPKIESLQSQYSLPLDEVSLSMSPLQDQPRIDSLQFQYSWE